MSHFTLTGIQWNTTKTVWWTKASAAISISRVKRAVPLMRSDKNHALKAHPQITVPRRDISRAWADQDLFAGACLWSGVLRKKHTVTVTTDPQICVASEEKVKHIVYLKMPKTAVRHKVGTQINHPFTALQFAHYPYLSWHSQKRNKASCQHLLCERELFQFKSWELQTSTPQCGQFWQSRVPKNTDWVQQLD